MIIYKSTCIKARKPLSHYHITYLFIILVINQCYPIRSLYNYFIVLLFENFGYTIWNESFEFFPGKCQRVMGLWEREPVRQQLWKIKELVTFSVSFPLLFYTILDGGSQSYWIDWSVLFSFLFFNLFLVLFSISSPESLVGVIKAAMPLQ